MPKKDSPTLFSVLLKKRPPVKRKNAEVRAREYLTEDELESLQAAARKIGRHGFRDSLMILLAYRHGLRVGELVALRWDQVNFERALLHVNRLKRGDSSVQPLNGEELRALRRLRRDYPNSDFLFCTERKGPFTERGFHKIVARAGKSAGISFPVHPHMLRHSTGFKLAQAGVDTRAIQAYLGHKNITHTVIYTKLDANRFRTFEQIL